MYFTLPKTNIEPENHPKIPPQKNLPNNSVFEFQLFILGCIIWPFTTILFEPIIPGWSLVVKETGPLELYFFFGPSVKDVLRQYHDLTGLPRMVPLAALGKHQSRWNYITPQDVMEVGGMEQQKHEVFGLRAKRGE